MHETKSLFKSKTFWFNLAVALAAIVSDNSEILRGSLSGGNYMLLMMLISAVNIYLRTITSTGITLK